MCIHIHSLRNDGGRRVGKSGGFAKVQKLNFERYQISESVEEKNKSDVHIHTSA